MSDLSPVCYTAGPMRGYARYNFDAFLEAEQDLLDRGYHVLSPARHDLDQGFDPDRTIEEQGFDLTEALRWDVRAVLRSDVVFVLPGWESSRGAQAEAALAHAAEIPVIQYPGLTAVHPPVLPERVTA